MKDDGLYRGDGAFEVIRLYDGRPFALDDHLDRLARSAAAIELEFDRAALELEIEALLAAAGPVDGQLRLIVTRGGRRIAATEPIPAHAETLTPRHRHLPADRDPQRRQVALLRRQHAGEPARQSARRRRGGAGAARRHRAGAADLGDLLGLAPTASLRTPALDDGVLESITRDRLVKALDVEEGSWQVDDLRGAERGLPRLDHARDPGGRRDRRHASCRAAPGPRTREAQRAFAETLGRELRELTDERAGEMDFQLSDEQKLIPETAREFADKEILPRVRDNDRAGRFDRELARKMGEVGYLGAPVAEEYGGRGLDYIGYGLIVEQIGRADSSARTVVSVVTSLVGGSIERWGSEEQKREWLPRLCSGESLGCFGLTEPDTGSDAANLRTRATKTDSGWSISGQKMWISLANFSDVALIFAQTDPEKKHRGLACFLVPTDSEGFTTQEIHGKLGLRSSDTAEISLDEVEVGDDAMLGEIGDGFKVAMSALDNGRYSVAAGCVGICDGCVDASVEYAKERKQFGVPLARFQLVQEMIADMILKRDASRMLVFRAGVLKDEGKPNTMETSVAKLYATESAVECANLAIQVHGGSGYVDDYPVERYLRDARVTTLYEGTSQIQKLIIGRAATGINAMLPFEES